MSTWTFSTGDFKSFTPASARHSSVTSLINIQLFNMWKVSKLGFSFERNDKLAVTMSDT